LDKRIIPLIMCGGAGMRLWPANNGERQQVKRIVVKPGGRLSLQNRARERVDLHSDGNESIYIPMGAVHRMENPGKIQLELIEVQTGSYLGEDDIIRIEDDYQRS